MFKIKDEIQKLIDLQQKASRKPKKAKRRRRGGNTFDDKSSVGSSGTVMTMKSKVIKLGR